MDTSDAGHGPQFTRYRIEAATVDGPLMPPGEAEFRIVGRLTHEVDPAVVPGADEPMRFTIADWAGPMPAAPPAVATTTDRGFKHYEDVTTDRGEMVKVYESSSAEGPHLWLQVTGEAHLEGPRCDAVGIPFGVAPASCAAHLTLDQARAVRDRLDAAIRGHYQRESGPCGRVLVGRGSDTFDPCCVLPAGHEGMCQP
jgi:hypothetical protein